MTHALQFFIDGQWVSPATARTLAVIDPATEQPFAEISLGSAEDVDRAVIAARAAFETFSLSTRDERLALLRRILACYDDRLEDLAQAISREMGAPIGFARDSQAWIGAAHLRQTIAALDAFAFDRHEGTTLVTHEPVGVVGLITPWNWPMNQIVCKVAPAIAAGCCCILKPSEIAPLSGTLFAEIMQMAGTPPGVFNLIQGDGPGVGEALATHPGLEAISFTGSTRAGIRVAELAAATVKRVLQELGGKSPNLVLPDADLEQAIPASIHACMGNSGQSCDAPTRLLVPRERQGEIVAIAQRVVAGFVTGAPDAPGTTHGPVVSQVQFDRIQRLIAIGIAEGATLAAGGLGRPDRLSRGYYVRPTLFADVTPSMTLAREEIFGPVLSIMPYDDVEQAIAIANDTPYGLAASVQSGDLAAARAVARRLRAGNVLINHPAWTPAAPFGGYKQSGNGREYAQYGLADFLEIKAVLGYGAA
jgi:aldehyde dehydrogenase (NAD+)